MQPYVSNCLNGRKYFLNGMGDASLAPQLLNAAAGVGTLQLHVVAMSLQPGQDLFVLPDGILCPSHGSIQLGLGKEAGNLSGIVGICPVPAGEGFFAFSCLGEQVSRHGQDIYVFGVQAEGLLSLCTGLLQPSRHFFCSSTASPSRPSSSRSFVSCWWADIQKRLLRFPSAMARR